MSSPLTDLTELEDAVTKRWQKIARQRDSSKWADGAPPIPDVPQFPREQWVIYPAKRAVALTLANRLMDFNPLADDQWTTVCHLVFYGGKVRIG